MLVSVTEGINREAVQLLLDYYVSEPDCYAPRVAIQSHDVDKESGCYVL